MTHEGDRDHPIGCQCMECYEGRATDLLGDRIAQLITQLGDPSLDESAQVLIKAKIRALETEQDRMVNNTLHL
jgi:hypothetical protein